MKNFKILLFLICLITSLSTKGQNPVEIKGIWQEGMIYYSGKLPYSHWNDSTRAKLQDSIDGYYFVFLPPVYKTKRKTVYFSIKPFYKNRQTGDTNIYVREYYQYMEGYVKPSRLEEKIEANCLQTSIDSSIIMYSKIVNPVFKTFIRRVSIDDYEKGIISDSIKFSYDYHYISEPAKVFKTTTFDAKDYPNMPKLKVLYLKGFNWSSFKQINCPACRKTTQIIPLQLALRDRGYQLPVTGILDETTKKALIDFQKKNGLVEGRLGMAVFQKLGVMSEFIFDGKIEDNYQYPNSPRLHH